MHLDSMRLRHFLILSHAGAHTRAHLDHRGVMNWFRCFTGSKTWLYARPLSSLKSKQEYAEALKVGLDNEDATQLQTFQLHIVPGMLVYVLPLSRRLNLNDGAAFGLRVYSMPSIHTTTSSPAAASSGVGTRCT